MKKVIVVFHDNNIKSGATASMLSLVEYWKTHNLFELEAIIPREKGSLGDELEALCVSYHILNYDMVRYHVDSNIITRFLKYFRGWYRVIRDLFNVYKYKNNKYFLDADYIYSNTSSIYFGMFLSKILDIKHVWHLREFGFEDQNCRHVISDYIFYKMANKYSNKVIVISQSLKDKIEKHIEIEKIFKIYNGIDSRKISIKDKISFKDGQPLKIIITGAVIPNKGQEFVIDVLGKLKLKNIPFQLGIAGTGKKDYVKYLKEKCEKLNISEYVKFYGFVSNMENILNDYNISIISSKSEAFGRVTIESMISGLLVVCSDSGANTELVSEENGYIYVNDCKQSLFNILECICQQDENIKLEKIRKSREISANFTVSLCANNICQVLGKHNEI